MGSVYFYELEAQPLEVVLPMLLSKAQGAGWRVELRGSDAKHLDALDQRLWLGSEESFAPHGRAGGQHDAEQPVLLTLSSEMSRNNAACLMSIDSADVSAEEVSALERVCILFDRANDAALQHARAQWKTLTGAGCLAQYWAQDGGRWVKKAES